MTPLTAGDSIEAVALSGELNEPWRAEISTEDERDVAVVWTEGLAFHTNVRGLTQLVDDDGEVRSDVADALQVELRRLLNSEFVYVDVSDQDEPALEVTVAFTVEPATVERLAELSWPAVAILTNVFDPGTFGAEYVMGTVAGKVEQP